MSHIREKAEAVIFDWAGTTVDYGCFAPVQAFLEVFLAYGIEPTVDEVRAPMGMLKRDHIRTMLAMTRIQALWQEKYKRPSMEMDVDSLYGLFEEKLMGILDQFAQVKPGVSECVEELRKRGVHIGSTTGYTDEMMEIVTRKAAEGGYAPDAWFSPNSVGNLGRPYPYMIYRNMERFAVHGASLVVKVGDTVSDIKEGKNAGVCSIGILEGSSEMGLSQAEYEALTASERQALEEKVRARYLEAGADGVIRDMGELIPWMRERGML